MSTPPQRTYRAGQSIEDYCQACGADRLHDIIVVDAEQQPLRVSCGFCRSQHNYRGGPRGALRPRTPSLPQEREREALPVSSPTPRGSELEGLEALLRRVIREESGLTPGVPAEKWRGGELVLKPGRPGLQEKSWPIDTFFHKIVMLRNRLRTLEQQINAADLPDDVKVRLQGYITSCYGSLTSFNVLFADDADRFRGASQT